MRLVWGREGPRAHHTRLCAPAVSQGKEVGKRQNKCTLGKRKACAGVAKKKRYRSLRHSLEA
jgi:hypothetical protein